MVKQCPAEPDLLFIMFTNCGYKIMCEKQLLEIVLPKEIYAPSSFWFYYLRVVI